MPQNDLIKAKISPKAVKDWWGRVALSKAQTERHATTWDMLLEEYKPNVTKSGQPEDVKTNAHFRNVEQKKAQLFFRKPEMRLTPQEPLLQATIDPETGQPRQDQNGQPITGESAVTMHEQVLNWYMGPDNVNLSLLVDRMLFDCLCPSGFMVSKIGYRPYIQMTKEPVMQPVMDLVPSGIADPLTGMPGMAEQPRMGVDGVPEEEQAIDEKGKPQFEDVPVLLKEEYFMSRVSPRKLLIPDDFKDTDFERSPWLGIQFSMPLRDAKRAYNLPDDFEASSALSEDLTLGKGHRGSDNREKEVKGVEIFYKAHLYIDDVVHPDVYYQLVLIDGHKDGSAKAAAVHRMSPYQEQDEQTKQLTPDSMLGNPIHVGTLRDLSDSAFVPSDSAMTHTLVKEIDTYRRQTVKLRDANIVKFGYDTTLVTPEALESLKTGDVGQYIPFEGGALQGGIDKAIAAVTKGSTGRSESEGAMILKRDLDETLAIGSNQAGSQNETARTATEISTVQSNANVRLKKEQNRVLSYVIAGVRKFDSLLQRFADADQTIHIVGRDGQSRIETWNKDVIAGRFAYDIQPDSQLDLDTATERSLHMQFYNLTAQDPYNVRIESLKKLQTLFGIDPVRGTQVPPEPGPPPPTVGFTFRGEDLVGPQAPIVIEIMEKSGIEISDESVNMAEGLLGLQETVQGNQEQAQLEHGGSAEKLPPISKHQEDNTAQLSGPKPGGI
jgi:hypothetical protein